MRDPFNHEAQAWLFRARDDLGAARKLLAGPERFPAIAAYHCQQAAEKALKAAIARTGRPIPKIHDLRVLVEICLLTHTAFDSLRDACEELTPYATEFRYPGDAADPTPDEIAHALQLASDVVDTVVRLTSCGRDGAD